MFKAYEDKIHDEMEFCRRNHFTGNIIFQVNFRDGKIGNMNIEIKQSFKLQGEKNE